MLKGIAQKLSGGFGPARHGAPSKLGVWLIVVAAVLGVGWYIAIHQLGGLPSAALGRPAQAGAASWWLQPIERNAFAALPAIDVDLRDIAVSATGTAIWVVGDEGFIGRSPDGGQSWLPCTVPPPRRIVRAPYRPDEPTPKAAPRLADADQQQQMRQEEAASSEHGALSPDGPTRDSATSGDSRREEPSDVASFLDIQMLGDAMRGWVVGQAGTILATSDGGATWSEQTSGTGQTLRSIAIHADGRQGWAAGDNGCILVTSDAGANWSKWDTMIDDDFMVVVMSDDGRSGWAAARSRIAHTTDAGATWNDMKLIRLMDTSLQSFSLSADGHRAWATDSFKLYELIDAGAEWTAHSESTLSGAGAGFVTLHPDGRFGWAVGWDGSILATEDGGESWSPQLSGTLMNLRAIAFQSDARQGWAVGAGGTVLATADGGATWVARTGGGSASLATIAMSADGKRGWMLHAGGGCVRTSDGGSTWSTQHIPDVGRLLDIAAHPDGRRAWAVGDGGVIVATSDGGDTWTHQAIGMAGSLRTIALSADGATARILAVNGTMYGTTDGGASWDTWGQGLGYWHLVAMDAKCERGLAANFASAISTTSDGGWNWRETGHRMVIQAMPLGVAIGSASSRMWVVGNGGEIASSSDGLSSWKRQESRTTADLLAIAMESDDLHGWIVGNRGTILETTDGGETWTPQPSGTTANLVDVIVQSGDRRALAVGTRHTLLELKRDGGWVAVETPHHRYPARWIWMLSGGLLLLLVGPAFRRSRARESLDPAMSDVLLSDRPIEPGDPDPLEAREVAGGVARFLANEATQPPLTIAITGAWGSGKSSLMNLIRGELKGYAFPTAWFNAWHHQSEQHLLGALMTSIQREAIPRWWRLRGIGFRLRLLALRGPLAWLPAVFFIGLFFLLVGALASDAPVDSGVKALVHRVESAFGDTADGSGVSTSTLVGLGVGTLVSFLALLRSLKMFTVSPSRIWALFTGAFSVRDVEAEIGFRQRFGEVFAEVTQALRPRTLVIFVDDLDRCRPENAVQVLETINFLVSHGRCCVVIGMAPDWVRRAVGLGFQDVAAEAGREAQAREPAGAAREGAVHTSIGAAAGEANGSRGISPAWEDDSALPPTEPEEATEVQACRARQDFAEKYLEKLINIEVPVPLPSAEALLRLLDEARLRAEKTPTPVLVLDALGRTGEGLVRWAPLLLALIVAAAGVHYGPQVVSSLNRALEPEQAIVRVIQPKSEAAVASESPPAVPEAVATAPPQREARPINAPRAEAVQPADQRIEAAQPSHWRYWPFAFVTGLLLMVGVAILMRLTKGLEQDTPGFRLALVEWSPLLYSTTPTPRAYKRFLNKARYYAMRQRGPTAPPGTTVGGRAWRMVLRTLRIAGPVAAAEPESPPGTPAATPEAVTIPDDILVVLSAIEHSHPRWLMEDGFWTGPADWIAQSETSGRAKHGPDWNALAKSLAGKPVSQYRKAFERIASEVIATS